MLKLILLSTVFLFLPTAALAAADLGIGPTDIKFSVAKPLAGEAVRIYASARNIGQQDARLLVRFYIDGTPLGSDQPTTVVVGGASTVFMDWVPSEGYYKVAAELVDINPGDGNSANNRAEIKDFLVNLDSDRDGRHDTEDLDDDNDGIDDGVEIINGTNPLKWDTDGDGVGDKDDAYPNDSSRTKPEMPAPSEPKAAEPGAAPAAPKSSPVAPAPKPVLKDQPNEPIKEAIKTTPNANRGLNLVIAKNRANWRSWEFEALGAAASTNYLWDFGDKKLGEGRAVKHVFPGSGTYKITLSGSDGALSAGQTEETVVIGWWHWANVYVQIILSLLGLGMAALALAIGFNLFPKYGEE